MNSVEQEIRKHFLEMIQSETNKLWSCAIAEDYKGLIEHAERLVILARRAEKLVELGAR